MRRRMLRDSPVDLRAEHSRVGWNNLEEEPADERTLQEAEGGRAQARRVRTLVLEWLRTPDPFALEPETICELHRHAMAGILPSAGSVRKRSDLDIAGSQHVLPSHSEVPALLSGACAFVNERPADDPLFVAAYILWRLCWIHPFEDGNGRTARAVSYLVLSLRLRMEIPGAHPIPERIKVAPIAYVRALEAADAACRRGQLDVSAMQKLLGFYLEAQLRDDPLGLPPSML